MSIHHSVLALRKALRYSDSEEGCCHGVTLRWIEACILNEEKIFDARIQKIDSEGISLVKKIDAVKAKLKRPGLRKMPSSPTREDQDRFEKSQYIITDEKFLYFNFLKKEIQTIELNQNILEKLRDGFVKDEQIEILSDDQFKYIASITGHTHLDEILTQEDNELLDILYFYESLELYQSSHNFFLLFNACHYHGNIDSISRIASSDRIKDRGGLMRIYSEPVIQTEEEIKTYLDELGQAIEKSVCSSQDNIIIMLTNMDHTVGLSYQPEVGWKFMDINQYPSIVFERHLTQKIAEYIIKGFKRPANTSSYIAFNTSILVTGNQEKRTELTEQLNAVKKNHIITPVIAQREEIVNLSWIAAQQGHADIIIALGKAGADLNKTNDKGSTPTFMAAQNGYDNVIGALGVFGNSRVDFNKANDQGATPAYMAAKYGHANVISALSAFGNGRVDFNKAVFGDERPTIIAAKNGYANVITALANAGADLNAGSNTPAYVAAQDNHASVVTVLGSAGADLDKENDNHETPLYIAAQNGHVDTVNALIAFGKSRVSLNKSNYNGQTPIYIAAQRNHANVITVLGKAGADLDQGDDKYGMTPAHLAAQKGYADVIAALGNAGADLNKLRKNGQTPLYEAARYGRVNAIKELLAHNAKLEIPYIATANDLRFFASKQSESVISRMNIIMQRQMDDGEKEESISIKPYDIAWIMGHENVLSLMRGNVYGVSASGIFASDTLKVHLKTNEDTIRPAVFSASESLGL